MSYEIKVNDEVSEIKILKRDGNFVEIAVDDRVYKADIVEVEKGVYSIIIDGTSFNIELSESGLKKYEVNTLYNSFDIEVIDPETKYMNSRKGSEDDDANFISTPMPGKVVKILVKEGEIAKKGETAIIVSAMKMESEYKLVNDKRIKQIMVKEGDNIDGHQHLILLEDIEE
ncbi:MAG: acetyl-CoA carboxylase biotin carboxyl carrier protein subunit [Marinilabiliales bacterium]|nr:MAG: acetyl-CoA carboxylase biotin carboxyl carrier protein subunit [Marinilabiliales bacterium]